VSQLAILGGKPTIQIGPEGRSPYSANPWTYRNLVDAFKRHTGARYATAVSSGTGALISGLMAAGVEPGDEVITVGHTWVATVAAILRCNAIPVFVDVDPATFTLDPAKIEAAITPRTRAILPVDLYGHPAPMLEIMEIAERHGLMVVEDACQAGGASIRGIKLGNIAHLTAFSFGGKTLSAAGAGGFLTTNDRRLYEKALLAGQHCAVIAPDILSDDLRRYLDFSGRGDNYRFPDPLAGAVLKDLESADARIEWRIRNADHLARNLQGLPAITLPVVKDGYKHVFHMFTCLFDAEQAGVSRDLFLRALRAEGVPVIAYVSHANFYFVEGGAAIHALPMHRRSIFRDLDYYGKGCPFRCNQATPPNYAELSLPVQERLHEQEFSLVQPTLSAPNGEHEMKLLADGIWKVIGCLDEIRGAAPEDLKQEPLFRY
jgi:dTDP-4-amino-4,6-dideoxygalactose transaminase